MTKVNSIIHISANEFVLLCVGENRGGSDSILSTNIGDFSPEEYTLGRVTQCFSKERCFAVRICSDKDCTKISTIEFK